MSDVERLAKDLGSALDDVRDDAFTRVRPFLRDAGDGTEETGMKLWKGLFYGMWNLDGDTQQVRYSPSKQFPIQDGRVCSTPGHARFRIVFWTRT